MIKRFFATMVISLALVHSAFAVQVPVDAKLDYNQGIDFYKLGMYERAIESFRSAIRTYPDYVDAYYKAEQMKSESEKKDDTSENSDSFEKLPHSQEPIGKYSEGREMDDATREQLEEKEREVEAFLKRQEEKEAIIAKQKAEREAEKAAIEAERKRKAECEELIQEAVKLKTEEKYGDALKKLKKASDMNIPEKEEAIQAIEQEVKDLKEKNSITGKLANFFTKILDED